MTDALLGQSSMLSKEISHHTDCHHHEFDTIEVLYLAAGSMRTARAVHRDIDVATEGSLEAQLIAINVRNEE